MLCIPVWSHQCHVFCFVCFCLFFQSLLKWVCKYKWAWHIYICPLQSNLDRIVFVIVSSHLYTSSIWRIQSWTYLYALSAIYIVNCCHYSTISDVKLICCCIDIGVWLSKWYGFWGIILLFIVTKANLTFKNTLPYAQSHYVHMFVFVIYVHILFMVASLYSVLIPLCVVIRPTRTVSCLRH